MWPEPDLVDKFRGDQRCYIGVLDQGSEQFVVESRPDDRRGVQCSLGGRFKAVNAGTNGGVKGGRDLSLVDVTAHRVSARFAVQHAALGQIAHHLLGEKRVSPSAFGHARRQIVELRIRAD